MKSFLINKIEEIITKETQKQELKENIEKFLEIYTTAPLSILDKNNTNLLNSIFTKIIPDFQNNKSVKNAQEIYIAYKQIGTEGIEEYLIEVNALLEYLKKIDYNFGFAKFSYLELRKASLLAVIICELNRNYHRIKFYLY